MKSIHNLVHKLTATEKRYIKLQFSKHKSDNGLIKLFDIINRQDEYDEKDLLKKSGNNITGLNKVRVSLRQLYSHILKYLRLYNEEKKTSNKLNGMAIDVQQLIDLNLIRDAKKMNVKLIHEAEKLQDFVSLIRGYQFQQWLECAFPKIEPNMNLNWEQEIDRTIDILKNLNQIKQIFQQTLSIYREELNTGAIERVKKRLDRLVNDPLLEDVSNMLCDQAIVHFYQIKSMASTLINDRETKFHCQQKMYEFSRISEYMKANPHNQILAASNYFNGCYYSGRLEAALSVWKTTVAEFESRNLARNHVKADHSFRYFKFRSTVMLSPAVLDPEIVKSLEPEIEENFEKIYFENPRMTRLATISELMMVLMYNGDYKMALKWINKANNSKDLMNYKAYFKLAKLAFIMLMYEKGQVDVVDNSIRSLDRFLKERDITFIKDELLLYNTIKKFVKAANREEIKAIAHKAISEVDDVMFFKCWFYSIAENVTMKDAFIHFSPKENYLQFDEENQVFLSSMKQQVA